MDIFFGVLVGILVLTLVVTIHEFGHFIIAKKNGVRVNEFGIGFPPKAKTWLHIPAQGAKNYCKKFNFDDVKTEKILKKSEKKLASKKGKDSWLWIPLPRDEWFEEVDNEVVPKTQKYLIFSLNLLPIGGFCQMDGESNTDTKKGTFGAASFWSKTKILFAGVAMNWLLAFVIFTVLAWVGMPEMFSNQYRVKDDSIAVGEAIITVKNVVDDSPAKAGNFEVGDIILEATETENGKNIKVVSATALTDFNNENAGKEVEYKIKRKTGEEETELTLKTTLNSLDSNYRLGISMGQTGQVLYRSTWSAPIVGAVTTVQLTGETYRGIGTLFGNIFSGIAKQFSPDESVRAEGKDSIKSAGDSVSGPVGIIGVLFPAITQTGLINVLFLMAIISISLACMNVLPIPALDGGRWLLIAIFKALHRPLDPETENKIVSRAFTILLILAAIITVLDVIKIVR